MYEAEAIVFLLRWWLYVGAGIAVLFLLWGIDRLDPSAHGAYAFRPLLVPGVMLLWPLVLWCWWRHARDCSDWPHGYAAVRGTAHRYAWLLLTMLSTAVLVTALSVRQQWPEGRPAVALESAQQAEEGAPVGAAQHQ